MPKKNAKAANLPVAAKKAKGKQPIAKLSSEEMAAAEYAGAGMETVGTADLLIPQLKILQKQSSQLEQTSPAFIEGAEESDICDTGTGRLHDEALFVPVIYRKQWIEWAEPRGTGSIVQIYNSHSIIEECTRDKDGPPRLPSGNPVIETAQFSGFLVDDDQYTKIFIAMSGSQLRKARRWLNLSTSEKIRHPERGPITAPLFWRSYIMGSQPEKNAKGSWAGWTIQRHGTLGEICSERAFNFQDVMEDALLFAKAISEGHERLNMASLDGTEEEAM